MEPQRIVMTTHQANEVGALAHCSGTVAVEATNLDGILAVTEWSTIAGAAYPDARTWLVNSNGKSMLFTDRAAI